MEQQVLLNLVHQPSDCSDFAGRLQAKAQNDMRGNLVQVPRRTLRPTLQGVAFPSRGFAEILRGRPAISASSQVRSESVSRSYLLASRHLPKQRCWLAAGVLAAAGARKEALKKVTLCRALLTAPGRRSCAISYLTLPLLQTEMEKPSLFVSFFLIQPGRDPRTRHITEEIVCFSPSRLLGHGLRAGDFCPRRAEAALAHLSD